ncbi:unnamed protein product [Alternaria alternata]
MAEQAREEFMRTFKSLLESGDYSDFAITCGSDTYNVHKNVVCTRSGFFKGAERFTANQGAATAKADLSEEDPVIVKLLVQYLYEGEYDTKLADMTLDTAQPQAKEACVNFVCLECCPDWASGTESKSTSDASQLLLSAEMYEIGDKYDVLGLKKLALSKFSLLCDEYWDDVLFAPAAHYAFSTTPENDKGLRDIVTQTIADHMDMLNSPAVEALLHEFNGLAVSLLTMRAKDLGWIKTSG